MIPLFGAIELPETFWTAVIGSVAFGAIGLVFLLFGFKLFEWVTPRLHVEEQLNQGNVGVGIAVAGLLVAIAIVVSHVVK